MPLATSPWTWYSKLRSLGIIAAMVKRQIGVEVLVTDHFWNDASGKYVYSFHCPACSELRLTPELGIYRCDCGSWLIVRNQQ
ncbi:MAG: hypothetical protein AABO41_13420 [Acidobacteriota bacterium]